MRAWLARAGVLRVNGSGSAADWQAYELALIIAEARAKGKGLAGLATDWSKCYDRLPLDILKMVAREAGIPDAIAGPMLRAYGQPRRIGFDGLVGEEKRPSCGFSPGCPAATDWLALVKTPWLKRARAISDQVSARAYVDDLTSWSKDPVDCA
eukprot:11532256-Heterocapsa_arctica.AAC.2